MEQESSNNLSPVGSRTLSSGRERVVVRVSSTLKFATNDPTAIHGVAFDPYIVRSGMSVPANLREAFKESRLLTEPHAQALAMIDTPMLMIPLQEYEETEQETLYLHTFPDMQGQVVTAQVLPDLNAVAVFAVNKDLRLVLTDHFRQVRYMPVGHPVWRLFLRKSFTATRQQLFAYFHDGRVEVMCFDKHRFKYFNAFDATHPQDVAYFILYVWKQLGFDATANELFLAGDIPTLDDADGNEEQSLLNNLRRFVQHVSVLTPTILLNDAGVANIKAMPLDMMALFADK